MNKEIEGLYLKTTGWLLSLFASFVVVFVGGGGGGCRRKEVNYRWQFVLTKLLLGEILLDGKQLHMCQLVLYVFHAILVLLTQFLFRSNSDGFRHPHLNRCHYIPSQRMLQTCVSLLFCSLAILIVASLKLSLPLAKVMARFMCRGKPWYNHQTPG